MMGVHCHCVKSVKLNRDKHVYDVDELHVVKTKKRTKKK